MKLSVILGLILAVHVAVAVVVTTPGCVSATPRGTDTPSTVVLPPEIPVMPPTVETAPVIADPVTLPPVVEPVDIPEKPAADNIYVIQKGDSLSKIAVRHGVKTAELQELNNIADPNKIRVGQKIVLPAHAKPSESKPVAGADKPAASSKPAATVADGIYVVKSGDALSKIAKAHGVKMADLMAANNITDANKIRIGQKLKIPVAPAAAAAAPAKPAEPVQAAKPAEKAEKPAEAPAAEVAPAAPVVTPPAADSFTPPADALEYTTNPGDTIDSLAGLFGTTADELRRINHLGPNAEVSAGQVIIIPPFGN